MRNMTMPDVSQAVASTWQTQESNNLPCRQRALLTPKEQVRLAAIVAICRCPAARHHACRHNRVACNNMHGGPVGLRLAAAHQVAGLCGIAAILLDEFLPVQVFSCIAVLLLARAGEPGDCLQDETVAARLDKVCEARHPGVSALSPHLSKLCGLTPFTEPFESSKLLGMSAAVDFAAACARHRCCWCPV